MTLWGVGANCKRSLARQVAPRTWYWRRDSIGGKVTEEIDGTSRKRLVELAVERWTKALIDTGKRNPLLYYRDLRAGTATFDTANESVLAAFLGGKSVSLSSLFPAPETFEDARRRIRTIRRKIVTLQEERGIQTGYLAIGLASWAEPDAQGIQRPPAAPVLLREISMSPRSASEDDFELVLAEEAEFNPVLIHYLSEAFGAGPALSQLPEDPDEKTLTGISEAFRALEAACSSVPGFTINSKLAVGSFAYQKLPMVKDLQSEIELLAESDVIAALAGDPDAQAALRAANGREPVEPSRPDYTPPQDEFLVLDADSSQSYAINAATGGSHLVVKGPPGTGKSQTIANLIAGLIARNKRVLFVAEKRAAIDAVLGRLESAQLDTWMMDLHDGLSNRRRVAQQLAETLERASRAAVPNLEALQRELLSNRARLISHSEMMHRRRAPWGFSAYELQARRLGLVEFAPRFRFRGPLLDSLTEEKIEQAISAVSEYADLGGLTSAEAGKWSGALVDTADEARQAMQTVLRLRQQTVPDAAKHLTALVSELGLKTPQSFNQWKILVELMDKVAELCRYLRPEAFTSDLPRLIEGTAALRWRKENGGTMSWRERRAFSKSARNFATAGKPKAQVMNGLLMQAAELNVEWRALSIDGELPRLTANLGATQSAFEQLSDGLLVLGAFLPEADLGEFDPATSLPEFLETLVRDQPLLNRLPRLRELERLVDSYGLGEFIDECRAGGVRASAVHGRLEAAWLDSILDEISVSDPSYGAFQGETLSRAVSTYQQADNRHIQSTGTRIQRALAEALYSALDAHPEQGLVVRKQANLKRRHMSMRDLLEHASDVLLAAKPCWAMSPLVVSQVLPMKRMFDVVIFDEASQIPPADAIPSIARAGQVVVAGDERQLPPTSFFASAEPEDNEDEGDEHFALTSGLESILDALSPIVAVRNLQWHYRSRDERLIAFSNAHIYDSSLTTFPGAHQDGVLNHIYVPWLPSSTDVSGSSNAEVETVADLVLQHAESHPHESLGVIAMGMKHADRIEVAIRDRLRDRTDLEEFFSESRDEKFFVKNLERVQGDERDAIILSVGYGKSNDGRMLYRFGPINNQGGERRLNVAVSRAKRRMSLVSSFASADLDANKLNSRGAELLGGYVSFMESGGTDLGAFSAPPPHLNAFEQDIRDRLSKAGLALIPQFGVSGFRIDFVATHPQQPGRHVLAIEADGASYHSSYTARDRDRLRQEHLERLGWRFHRIWSTDWFRDPQSEVDKVLTSFEAAVAASDHVAMGHVKAEVVLDQSLSEMSKEIPSRTAPKPRIRHGEPITFYSRSDLVSVIGWIESDGLLRTEEDIVREAMDVFGWRRRGARIDTGLREAIAMSRRKDRRPKSI